MDWLNHNAIADMDGPSLLILYCAIARSGRHHGRILDRPRGVSLVKPGVTIGDIGDATQSFVEAQHMSVVRDFCGSGIGRLLHNAPYMVHVGKAGEDSVLRPGMFFTIQPQINLGRPHVKVLSDGWTAVTRDRFLSAEYCHTLAVTETGMEIFTLSPQGLDKPGGAGPAEACPEPPHDRPEDSGCRGAQEAAD